MTTGTHDGRSLPPSDPELLSDSQILSARIMARWVRRSWDTDPPAESGPGSWYFRNCLIAGCHDSRKHEEMSFHLAQLMTGHGCFNRYLWKINRAPSAGCSHCGPSDCYTEMVDDAHHTLVCCEAYEEELARLDLAIGPIDPDGLSKMLESPANWEAVIRFAREVTTAKESAERDRQFRQVQGVALFRRRRRWQAARGQPRLPRSHRLRRPKSLNPRLRLSLTIVRGRQKGIVLTPPHHSCKLLINDGDSPPEALLNGVSGW